MPEILDLHGPHVNLPMTGHVRLTWYEPAPRASRIRVILHTCACRETTYELCAAADQAFVRRTDRMGETVRETSWTSTATAVRIFAQILRGEAR